MSVSLLPPSRFAAAICRPYIRLELPAWGKLYGAAVGTPECSVWDNAPTKVIRGKLHGYRMRLHLSNWSERSAYFLARYYDLESQLAFQLMIDPGDVVFDVGANVGMTMLLAAKCVGATGVVHCIEPNPTCIQRLRDHVEINGIRNVQLHHSALGDNESELILRVVTFHTGMGTLADVPDEHKHLVTASIPVRVRCGDELASRLPRQPRVIKMDVEGFEYRAIRGLSETIVNHRPLLMLEFVECHLNRAGSSRAELLAHLSRLGYEGFSLLLRRKYLRYHLAFQRIDPANLDRSAGDTIWAHCEDTRLDRIRQALL